MSGVLMIALGVVVFLALSWIGTRMALNKLVPPDATD